MDDCRAHADPAGGRTPIAPLIFREMAYIPALALILGIAVIITLFGGYAAIVAGPIAVIILVAVKKLHIRDSLGDPTPIPVAAAGTAVRRTHVGSRTTLSRTAVNPAAVVAVKVGASPQTGCGFTGE